MDEISEHECQLILALRALSLLPIFFSFFEKMKNDQQNEKKTSKNKNSTINNWSKDIRKKKVPEKKNKKRD